MDETLRTACFTGHRPRAGLRFDAGDAELACHVDAAVLLLAQQEGVTRFLCGMANGFDLFAAQRVLALKRDGRLPEEVQLVAVQPFPQHGQGMRMRWRAAYQQVLDSAVERVVVSADDRRREVFKLRNAYLVNHSQFVVAYWNHCDRTGTGQTVRMAQQGGRVLINLYDL